jgi:hypothetical protein
MGVCTIQSVCVVVGASVCGGHKQLQANHERAGHNAWMLSSCAAPGEKAAAGLPQGLCSNKIMKQTVQHLVASDRLPHNAC